MSFLDTVFGRKKPTASTAAAALADLEAELATVPALIARAQDALRRVADLSDEQHAAAEGELAAARRAETRLTAQIEQLRAAHEQAEKAEAAAALRARAAAARKRVDAEMPKLIQAYEAKAGELAEIAAVIRAIDNEADAVNRVIDAAERGDAHAPRLDRVTTSYQRYRTEPDVVEPDRTVVEEKWEECDPRTGLWTGVGVYGTDKDGKLKPTNAGARLRKVERVVPGERRKGRSLPSPVYGLNLPAARLDGPSFWPRAQS